MHSEPSARISHRKGHKAAVVFLLVATVVYTIGFGVPYWGNADQNAEEWITVNHREGLWLACVSFNTSTLTGTECGLRGVAGFPAWFHAARALSCLCLAFNVIACTFTLAINCCRSTPGPYFTALELMAGFGGIFGFIGSMLYVTQRNKEVTPTDSVYQYTFITDLHWKLGFAYYLAVVGSGCCTIAAVLIAISNRPLHANASTNDMPMTHIDPDNPAYPRAQARYPGAQVDNPGAQAGYPGAMAGYAGAQAGYPGTQAGYPGAQAGYPGTQAGYPGAPVGSQSSGCLSQG